MKTTITLTALLAVLALPVLAQTPPPAPRSAAATPSVDQRQLNQQQRIDQGVQSGALTSKEAARLEGGQQHVQKMEDKAKADGKVTPQERKRLQHAENVQNRKIERQKHDRQHDYNHDGKQDRPRRRH
jgi:Skp family chaperone for outer membrane proteins